MHRGVVLVAILGLLPVFSTARSRETVEDEKHRVCSHTGSDLWDVVRILPVRFVDFDEEAAYWRYEDEHVVKFGSFALYKRAEFLSTEEKIVDWSYVVEHKDSSWLCFYCSSCHAILRAYELKSRPARS